MGKGIRCCQGYIIEMNIQLLDSQSKDEWDNYIISLDKSSLYHLSCWKGVIEMSFGHKAYYLLARDAVPENNGCSSSCQIKSRLFGDYIVSIPFLTMAVHAGITWK